MVFVSHGLGGTVHNRGYQNSPPQRGDLESVVALQGLGEGRFSFRNRV